MELYYHGSLTGVWQTKTILETKKVNRLVPNLGARSACFLQLQIVLRLMKSPSTSRIGAKMEAFKSYGKHFVNVICMRSNICLHFVKTLRLNSKLVGKSLSKFSDSFNRLVWSWNQTEAGRSLFCPISRFAPTIYLGMFLLIQWKVSNIIFSFLWSSRVLFHFLINYLMRPFISCLFTKICRRSFGLNSDKAFGWAYLSNLTDNLTNIIRALHQYRRGH